MNLPKYFRIAPLIAADHTQWEPLVRDYKAFYQTTVGNTELQTAWNRLTNNDGISGSGAFVRDEMVGFAHFLFHTTIWDSKVCFLQDLFVDSKWRGHGIARELIQSVAQTAVAEGSTKFYWMTHEANQPARLLYGKLASYDGFIRYDFRLKSLNE